MTSIVDITTGYAYIRFVMGGLIEETGWENTTYIFLCERVWDILDVTTEPTDSTEVRKYKALLEWVALDHFARELSTAYDFTADGESNRRSQMFTQVRQMRDDAYTKASPYLPEAESGQDYIDLGYSPYRRST
jgi:hypothetical protein